jgi:hypothetical protein
MPFRVLHGRESPWLEAVELFDQVGRHGVADAGVEVYFAAAGYRWLV